MKEYLKNNWKVLLAVAFLSAFTFRIVFFLYLDHISELALMSYNPILGEAYWRAFQNRLLGPFLMYLIALIPSVSIATSFKIVLLGLLFLANSSVYLIFKGLKSSEKQILSYLILFNFLVLILQDNHLIMVWDLIDIIIFFWFFYGLLKKKKKGYFIVLFLVGIVNRESALFIALWFLIDGLFPLLKKPGKIDFKKLVFGSVLMLTGFLYTWWTRKILFKESMMDFVGKDLEHATVGNHLNLFHNLKLFEELVLFIQIDIMAIVFIAFICWMFWSNREKLDSFALKTGILMFAMISAIWLFGIITETRQYLYLIPGTLMIQWYLYRDRTVLNI